MKKLFTSIWISVACCGVMILTGILISVFYITVFFRKLFVKDFTPNALRDSTDERETPIASAKSQINAIKASWEKTETQRG